MHIPQNGHLEESCLSRDSFLTTSSPFRLDEAAVNTPTVAPAFKRRIILNLLERLPHSFPPLVHNRARPQCISHPSDHQRAGWQLPVVKWRGGYFDSIIFLMSRLELINVSAEASAWLTLRNINWTFPSLLTAVIHFKCYLFPSFCTLPKAVFCGTVFLFLPSTELWVF